MKRRTQGVLLVGGLAVATVISTVVGLSVALGRVVDRHHQCENGLSIWTGCTAQWSSTTTRKSSIILSVEQTSWAVAHCPQNDIARRALCAAAAPAQAASDDFVAGLPLPKPWVLRTAKNSPFIKSIHIETPLDLAAVLGFYRVELSKRGWTEKDGAVVEPGRAVI